MALTATYSVTPLLTRILPGAEPAENSDTVGLSSGGFATVADFPDGSSTATIYDAAGNNVGLLGLNVHDSKIAQLDSGDVIIVGTSNSGGIFASSLAGVFSSITADPTESNADIAALPGGGFVVVSQRDFTASTPDDHDIEIRICDSFGTVVFNPAVDTSVANDQNASVAVLTDGGIAVAWERINASGHSAAWVAVYNADGSVRKAPYLLDGGGTINHQMNVTALQSGGFAISYEDNGWSDDGLQSDITVTTFDATGVSTHTLPASSSPTNDSQAALTTLSNGLVMSTFTNDAGTDTDIRGTLIDPTTGALLTNNFNPLVIAAGQGDDNESSVSATGLAQFVVSYSDTQFGDVTQKTFQLVRTITGDDAEDTFTGDDAVDVVNGLGGNDTLAGAANSDTLSGGDGSDYLNGGAGNDTLNGGNSNDFLVGGDGADTLNGGAGADALLGGLGNDLYNVDNASDEVSETSTVATEIDVVVSSVTYTLGANVEKLALTGAAVIHGTGNALANLITGNTAANILTGGAGNDTLKGGIGSDTLDGGANVDTADYSEKTTAVAVTLNGATNATVAVGGVAEDIVRNVENVTGGAAGDTLRGDGVANVLLGNAGNDSLRGGIGSDTLDGGANLDTADYSDKTTAVAVTLNGATNVTVAIGGVAEDIVRNVENVTGGTAGDTLRGDAAANLFSGGGGADLLSGGGGNDGLTGGADGDNFLFNAALNVATNLDHIIDFAAIDTIQLENAIFTALTTTGTIALGAFHSAAGATSAHDLDDRIVYNTTTGALFYDADGNLGGGVAAVQFAVLDNHAALTNADFFVV